VLWLGVVGVLILLAYGTRASSGKPDRQVLYHWSTAVGGLIQDAVVLAIVLLIARPQWELLAWRRPENLARTLATLGIALVAVYIFEGAYVINAIVICTWVPFVEETTYRGLGYSLLERFGRWPAILLVGLLFGLSHGLLVSLPIIVLFGCVLAWIRSRTDSVFPGMVLHGSFNLIALVVAVVH